MNSDSNTTEPQALDRAGIRALYERLDEVPLEQVADADLLQLLEHRYATEPVPPCRVCGGTLSIASIGGGEATRYACLPVEDDPDNPGRTRHKEGRSLADDHYARSRWTHYQEGDAEVRELVARYRRHMKSQQTG